MNLWYCPNGKRFMHHICHILRTQESHVAVYLPPFRISQFLEEFCKYSTKYFYADEFSVEHGSDPCKSLISCFSEIDKNLNHEVKEILEKYADNQYLIMNVSSSLNEKEMHACHDFILQIARLSKYILDEGYSLRWKLLIVLPAYFPQLNSDVCLISLLWWGNIHQSDVEYAIEQSIKEIHPTGLHVWEYYWMYSLCQGLAPSDPMLAFEIYKNIPTTVEEIYNILKKHPLFDFSKSLNKDIDDFFSIDINIKQSRTLAPHGCIYNLWCRGILDIDSFGKISLHPAVLLSTKRYDQLNKLIVQGQIRVYLPLLQEVHNYLCQKLKQCCGDNWIEVAKSNNFNTLDVEINGIPRYMSEFLSGKYHPANLLDIAILWRNIRNQLAHGNIISCRDAIKACKLYSLTVENC